MRVLSAVVQNRVKEKIIDIPGSTPKAASLDGKYFISKDNQKRLRVWSTSTGQPVGQWLKPPDWGACTLSPDGDCLTTPEFTLSPDGKRIAFANNNDDLHGTIQIWDVATGRESVGPMVGHTEPVVSLNFSQDGAWLISGSERGMIRVWNTSTGQVTHQVTLAGPWREHADGIVVALATSPDGRWAAGQVYFRDHPGVGDDRVQLWDARTGQLAGTPFASKVGRGLVHQVEFSEDGNRVAIAVHGESTGMTVQVWDTATRTPRHDPIDVDYVQTLALSHDGSTLAYVGDDNTVHVINADSGKPMLEPLKGHTSNVSSIAFVRESDRILATDESSVRIWDFEADMPKITMRDSESVVESALRGDADRVASFYCSFPGNGVRQCAVGFWNTTDGAKVGSISTDDDLFTLDYSGDGRRLVSIPSHTGGNAPTEIQVRNADTGQLDGAPIPIGANGSSPTFSDDGHMLAVLVGDSVQLYDVDHHAPVRSVPRELTSVVAFNRGRQLILATIRGTIRLWNLEAGQPPTAPVIGHTAEITAVAVSPDGHYFATASDDTTVRIWDASTGKPIGTPLTGHSGAVNAVAFSPDSRMLASGGTDGNVLLWDVDTHRTLADPFVGFDRSGRGVDRVGFNADGQRVVAISVGDHGTVRSWPTAAKPADLCAKVTINMSHKQWNEWVSPDIDYIKVCPELPIAPD
ncbi:MAG: hypothetical protein QOH60_3730 [Mycobacterium sp.]|nr:hypothetical protein [Mycobacterium sp.]